MGNIAYNQASGFILCCQFFLFCGRSPIVLSLPSSMFVMKLQNMLSSVHTEITDSLVVL